MVQDKHIIDLHMYTTHTYVYNTYRNICVRERERERDSNMRTFPILGPGP